jgi:kynurenine--oxoglutarate transaminase/cysteine-S-conjugate beta-lyase/glutamine--phenylpyruvate transaminase
MVDSRIESVSKHYKYSDRFEKVGDRNIWVEINDLSREYKCVDLAEGFANYISYEPLTETVQEMSKERNCDLYQYTRNAGHLRLVNAIGKHYSKIFKQEINPLNEVLITIGAYGSLHNAITSLLNKNDEVILFEPFFDCYEPMVLIAEGKCVYVPLKPADYLSEKDQTTRITSADWCLDEKELEAAFNSRTKLLIFNNPNNPLGKVFTQKEMDKIAQLCIKHNVICISDEVYEYITYENPHIRMASLPGMWERTLTIGSAGKTFASTGVKIGWTIGPQELVNLCKVSNDIDINVCPTFFQEAIARCFEKETARIFSNFHRNKNSKMLKLSRVFPSLGPLCSRNISVTSTVNRGNSLARLDNEIMGLANHVFRDMDREFERMRNRMTSRFNLLTPEIWSDPTAFIAPMSLLESEQNLLPSMVTTDKEGNRKFQLALNLKEFKPEEIKVKTVGKNLVVSAKTERKDENDYYLREISQSYQLPNDLNVEELKSKVNDDGMLICDAPLPKLTEAQKQQEKPIPIEHESLTQLKGV